MARDRDFPEAVMVVLFVSILLATPALGQDCSPSRRDSAQYCFALDVIRSLEFAHHAYTLYGDSTGPGSCAGVGATDVFYRAKQRERALKNAYAVLRTSEGSPDSIIRTGVNALEIAYTTYLHHTRDVQRYCGYVADQSWPPGLGTPGRLADSVAQMRLLLDNASVMLAVAVAQVAKGLTKRDAATSALTFLQLSAEQRETLLRAMVTAFGLEVTTQRRDSVHALSTPFATATGGLYMILADPGWRLEPPRR